MTESSAASAQAPTPPPHPIAAAMLLFLHRCRDAKLATRHFMPLAHRIVTRELGRAREDLTTIAEQLESGDDEKIAEGMKRFHQTFLRADRWIQSDMPQVLETGLFLSLFSALDAYTGSLLRGLYARRPELFDSLNRDVPFKEILASTSLDDVKARVLEDDIEQFRRKSYVEQFVALEARFGLALRKFPKWPAFVECAQRRNLFTHCDGIVSTQYLEVCAREGVPKASLPTLGTKLTLGPEYMFSACELLFEVGLKLGHTLWRRTLPGELEESDQQLNATIYECLHLQNWPRARMVGEFALSLPELHSEVSRGMLTINYAQALKWSGDTKGASDLLGTKDWSASAPEFRLAEAVLNGRFPQAATIMHEIGPKSARVGEHAYYEWPLFKEFRTQEVFLKAFRDIFGHSYVEAVRTGAAALDKKASEHIEQHEQAAADQARASLESPSPAQPGAAQEALRPESPGGGLTTA